MITDVLPVSEKNKKSEILDAYHDLLKKLELKSKEKAALPIQNEAKQKENNLREKTRGYSTEAIQREGVCFEKKINETMAGLVERLLSEHGAVEKMLVEALNKLQEAELAELRKLKLGFEVEKEQVVSVALESQAERIKKEYESTMILNVQKAEAEKNLLAQQLKHYEVLVVQKDKAL